MAPTRSRCGSRGGCGPARAGCSSARPAARTRTSTLRSVPARAGADLIEAAADHDMPARLRRHVHVAIGHRAANAVSRLPSARGRARAASAVRRRGAGRDTRQGDAARNGGVGAWIIASSLVSTCPGVHTVRRGHPPSAIRTAKARGWALPLRGPELDRFGGEFPPPSGLVQDDDAAGRPGGAGHAVHREAHAVRVAQAIKHMNLGGERE